jgi:hypothetical protein
VFQGRIAQAALPIQPGQHFGRQTGTGVFDPDLGASAIALQAHPHWRGARRETPRFVDQVAQRTLDPLQGASQRYLWRWLARFKLLHGVPHPVIEVEAFVVQHLVGGL